MKTLLFVFISMITILHASYDSVKNPYSFEASLPHPDHAILGLIFLTEAGNDYIVEKTYEIIRQAEAEQRNQVSPRDTLEFCALMTFTGIGIIVSILWGHGYNLFRRKKL